MQELIETIQPGRCPKRLSVSETLNAVKEQPHEVCVEFLSSKFLPRAQRWIESDHDGHFWGWCSTARSRNIESNHLIF
jgi:hypothetical protein